ncbi:MAG: ATP-binding protein [Candidatus Hydrogenedentes bacterium]|nr:ATP-binding protein [Candidatus Hydrogenedentota bacterium]
MTLSKGQYVPVIRQKITDSLKVPLPIFTERDIHLPRIPGKAMVVIGMRRSGKTTFLWQCLASKIKSGVPRKTLLYFSFEDERLIGMTADDLQWIIEEYYILHPELRDKCRVTLFFDEIQVVQGWEQFVRRLMDTEQIDIFLSGSSSLLLSREVATSMRGRGVEVLVHPFSFRESLRHKNAEPATSWNRLSKAKRSAVEKCFRDYLVAGGFPEAQGLTSRDRAVLLRSYVDVATLRDVIERHQVTNPIALRWVQRHLLGSPASPFSIQKFYNTLKSQGVAVGKNTLHQYLAHLEDAFLIRTVSLHTASERQRMVNPRKSYPVDPGLISVYERMGRSNLGHALETVVFLELERRGYDIGYIRTREGWEVDFFATCSFDKKLLIQVCADTEIPETLEREVRALQSAAITYPDAVPLLLTLDTVLPHESLPKEIRWMSVLEWLLNTTDDVVD